MSLSLLENDFGKYLKKVKGTTVHYDSNVAKEAFKPKAQSGFKRKASDDSSPQVKKKAKSTTKERDSSSNDEEDEETMF
jgi:hypothetical protein